MSKVNEFKDKKLGLYEKEHKIRHSSSALPTFFKWFRRTDRNRKRNGVSGNSSSFDSSGSHETLNSTSQSTSFDQNSIISSSCDSVLSTSTTGFAFIKPSNYKPEDKKVQKKLFLESDLETDTHQRRMNLLCTNSSEDDENKLTLRTKYSLHHADDKTLTSNHQYNNGILFTHYNRAKNFDNSLPIVKSSDDGKYLNSLNNSRKLKYHRRTVSESCKEKRAGAYVHVKGKRRAPQPPLNCADRRESYRNSKNLEAFSKQNNITTSPSTLSIKKKRRAPPPPYTPTTSKFNSTTDDELKLTSSEIFFSEEDINAILQKSSSSIDHNKMESSSRSSGIFDFTPKKLTDNQKQIVIEKVIEAQTTKDDTSTTLNQNITNDVLKQQQQQQRQQQQIPSISPKPWYKRSISTNRESSIPFKREVVLKTMEKRKQKDKNALMSSNLYPENSNSRSSSIFDTNSHKFGFFGFRYRDHSISEDMKLNNKEKRKSGIGIPNISELDREAAEIVQKEHEKAAKASNDSNLSTSFSDQVILQQQMFLPKEDGNKSSSNHEVDEDKIASTKELVSKFDADSSTSKVSLNTSFIGRTDLFTNNPSATAPTSNENVNEVKPEESVNSKKIDDNNIFDEFNAMPKLSWTCPTCTLENPSWRIMCEVCERLKPFEKIDIKNTKNLENKKEITTNSNILMTNQDDWNKKTEKMMKYFKPRQSEYSLSKSSSESFVGKQQQLLNKSPSPSKLPIGSPKLTRTRPPEIIGVKNKTNVNQLEIYDEIKKPLLNSSVVVTTVTPVFYASISSQPQPSNLKNIDCKSESQKTDLKEIRNARLLKFSPPKKQNGIHDQDSIKNLSIKEKDVANKENDLLNDPNYLEMEKRRLREKIRAMNVKALTEKYPVLQKAETSDESTAETLNDSSLEKINQNKSNNITSNNQGAIKKVFPVNHNNVLENEKNSVQEMDDAFSKPLKVTASVQTRSNLVKKTASLAVSENFKILDDLINQFDEDIVNNTKIEPKKIQCNEKTKDKNYFKTTENRNNDETIELKRQKYRQKTLSDESNNVGTVALSKIMKNLELAISEGDDELAAKIAMDLARMKVSLQVTKNNKNKATKNFNKTFRMDVIVEDKILQTLKSLEITPTMTLIELKEKAFNDFQIPIKDQKWFINEQIANEDSKTLQQYKVYDNSSKFKLCCNTNEFINKKLLESKAISSKSDDSGGGDGNDGAAALSLITNNKPSNAIVTTWECPLCTLINSIDSETCIACTKAKPKQYLETEKQNNHNNVMKTNTNQFLDPFTGVIKRNLDKNDLNKSNSSLNRKSAEIFNIIDESLTKLLIPPQIPQILNTKPTTVFHFASPNITKYKYRGVDNFNPNRKYFEEKQQLQLAETPTTFKENTIIERLKEEKNELLKEQESKKQKQDIPEIIIKNHYTELLDLENSDIVLNIDTFECPVCFVKFEPGQGVVLRDCLHTFCKECLGHTVQFSDEAEVKCPYMDVEYSCTSVLQDREIKAVVTKKIYELHLAKSVRVAEHQIENTFHCKTPNCRGWCIYEDNVNQFKCPVCKITNCLTCRVIHDGLTCKQYQDRLNSDCDSNLEARRTKEMLKEMVEKGEAMNCPTCQVILMKKWGCDWLRCSMCKTEVCWVTRGPRWGPGGKGDTTAGCKCGVDGKKCHPKCNYCH